MVGSFFPYSVYSCNWCLCSTYSVRHCAGNFESSSGQNELSSFWAQSAESYSPLPCNSPVDTCNWKQYRTRPLSFFIWKSCKVCREPLDFPLPTQLVGQGGFLGFQEVNKWMKSLVNMDLREQNGAAQKSEGRAEEPGLERPRGSVGI